MIGMSKYIAHIAIASPVRAKKFWPIFRSKTVRGFCEDLDFTLNRALRFQIIPISFQSHVA